MARLAIIQPCLWFDDQAEEAARFYTGIFPDSAIGTITRYTDVGQEHHGKPVGSVLTVAFTLAGQPFLALNGGPVFRFNEALSLQQLAGVAGLSIFQFKVFYYKFLTIDSNFHCILFQKLVYI